MMNNHVRQLIYFCQSFQPEEAQTLYKEPLLLATYIPKLYQYRVSGIPSQGSRYARYTGQYLTVEADHGELS